MINTEYRDSISELIGYLSGFVMENRFNRLRDTLEKRTKYFTVCTENMFHPQNASALVRHCDAFGLQELHTIENLCKFRPNVNIVKGTDKWVTIQKHSTTGEAIKELKDKGYRIVSTTPHIEGTTPSEFDIHKGPFCLVFGTEHEGIGDEFMTASDGFIKIPMYGMVESLNVSASAAIIIQTLTEKLRSSDIQWQLAEEEKEVLLFEWLKK